MPNDVASPDSQPPPRTPLSTRSNDKSLRWLALVASQRLQLMQPKGRQRMREAGDARRGFALPKAVISKVPPDPKANSPPPPRIFSRENGNILPS